MTLTDNRKNQDALKHGRGNDNEGPDLCVMRVPLTFGIQCPNFICFDWKWQINVKPYNIYIH